MEAVNSWRTSQKRPTAASPAHTSAGSPGVQWAVQRGRRPCPIAGQRAQDDKAPVAQRGVLGALAEEPGGRWTSAEEESSPEPAASRSQQQGGPTRCGRRTAKAPEGAEGVAWDGARRCEPEGFHAGQRTAATVTRHGVKPKAAQCPYPAHATLVLGSSAAPQSPASLWPLA